MPVLSGRINFVLFSTTFQKLPWNTAKIVKNLQCLKTLQMCYLGHAKHHAKPQVSTWSSHDTLLRDDLLYKGLLKKKSVSWAVHLVFVDLYCCFIQKRCINNDWKCDFLYLRCLFYKVQSILFLFLQLQIFVFQKFPWNTAKMVKIFQCLKTPQICYLTHAEHHAKDRTSLRGLDHDTLFFE